MIMTHFWEEGSDHQGKVDTYHHRFAVAITFVIFNIINKSFLHIYLTTVSIPCAGDDDDGYYTDEIVLEQSPDSSSSSSSSSLTLQVGRSD